MYVCRGENKNVQLETLSVYGCAEFAPSDKKSYVRPCTGIIKFKDFSFVVCELHLLFTPMLSLLEKSTFCALMNLLLF